MISARAQFNLFEGEARRDEGISLTTGNNLDWMANAFRIVCQHLPEGEFMAEIFRTFPGIGSPNHPNAWGALTRTLVQQHVIVATGEYAKASSVRNHAHTYKVYRRRLTNGGSVWGGENDAISHTTD
jgi:hypothetical protein